MTPTPGQRWLADVTGRVPWAKDHQACRAPVLLTWVSHDEFVVEGVAYPPGRQQERKVTLSVDRLERELVGEREWKAAKKRQSQKAKADKKRKKKDVPGMWDELVGGDGT